MLKFLTIIVPLLFSAAAIATDNTAEFDRFRAEMEQDNPSELFEMRGESLWSERKGPHNLSLSEVCDMGKGIGVTIGAYAALPRFFQDAGTVMDAERRLVYCITAKQGLPAPKQAFSNDRVTPDHVSILTWLAAESKGFKLDVNMKDPAVSKAYAYGKEVFHRRAGAYDFSCQTCHGESGKRIRMQVLPKLNSPAEAFQGVKGWPGYRMTGGYMLTQQWRMNDCLRQQRMPEPEYLSDTVTALLTYLTANANGNVYTGPGIKR